MRDVGARIDDGRAVALMREMDGARLEREGLEAMGWVDLKRGTLVAYAAESDEACEALELAACAAHWVCATPSPEDGEYGTVAALESFVVSSRAVHVFARRDSQSDRALVGVAPPRSNLALLLSSLRSAAVVLARSEAG